MRYVDAHGLTVYVRELRQNLGKYLARVKARESFVVIERGREVARLTVSGGNRDPLAHLIATRGASIPPGSQMAELGPRHPVRGRSASEALAEQREERL